MLRRPPSFRQTRRHLLHVTSAAALIAAAAFIWPVSSQDSRSQPIARAILKRDVSAVRSIVEGGEEIDQRLFNRDTPAIMAATGDSWDIVLYLLKAGADPALKNRMGVTIASMAKTSLVAPHTEAFRDLEAVRKILASKGLL